MADHLKLLWKFLQLSSRKLHPSFLTSNNVIHKITRHLKECKNSHEKEEFCEVCGHAVNDEEGEVKSFLAPKWNIEAEHNVIKLEKLQILCKFCHLLRNGPDLLNIISSTNEEGNEKVNMLACHLCEVNNINTDQLLFLEQIIAVSQSIGVLLKTLVDIKVLTSKNEIIDEHNLQKIIKCLIKEQNKGFNENEKKKGEKNLRRNTSSINTPDSIKLKGNMEKDINAIHFDNEKMTNDVLRSEKVKERKKNMMKKDPGSAKSRKVKSLKKKRRETFA